MTKNLLKKLLTATVIIFTVGVCSTWAEEFKSKLPKCKGEYSSSWNNCYGKQKFINGSYEGEFKNALYDGNGIFKLDTGEQYIGEFKDMLKHGYGTWTGVINNPTNLNGGINFAAGIFGGEVKAERYFGHFKNGMKEGKGTYIFGDGTVYSGNWKEDFANGYGEYIFGVGKYIGEFKNGMKQGKGFHIFNDGIIENEGIWHGDQFLKSEKVSLKNFNYIKYMKEKTNIEKEFEDNKNYKNLKICENFEYIENSEESFITNFEKKEIEKSKKLNNCWGKYTDTVLTVYEGEWVNGKLNGKATYVNTKGNKYVGFFKNNFKNGFGKELTSSTIYIGEYINGDRQGRGIEIYDSGANYIGDWKSDLYNGKGIFYNADKTIWGEGIFEDGYLKSKSKVNVSNIEKFIKEKEIVNQYVKVKRINLQVTNTQANAEGDFVINIQTGTDTASLKINGEEQGGKQDGTYSIKRIARAGQETKFTILAKDVYGNSDSKTISVARQLATSSQIKYAELNPALVKTQPNKDAVAIIIGIADYKNLPRADFANDDARAFYDYAMRGLGVRAENIKLLVDGDAGQGEILKTFKTWLPSRVKSTTDVYVYYSGHGLPSADGQTLYLLPQQADRDLIEDTAVAQNRINAAIQATKPKSVTIFLDSCYSGAARTGQTLLASARPISLKANAQTFPSDFTVFTASTAEQISSSSNELKHGIFSYYLMRGMEGDADTNKDGKITAGEMHTYLSENVAKQASLANRVQQPQLAGDANRVLIGR